MKKIILVHPAGIGDAFEDLILIKSILNYNDIELHYVGNFFLKELLALVKIKKITTTTIDKRNLYSFKNIKSILKIPKYADMVYIMPGMNLKKAAMLKYLLKPKYFLGGLLAYPQKNIKNILPKVGYYDFVDNGNSKNHRLINKKRFLSNFIAIDELDFNIFDYSNIKIKENIDDYNISKRYIIIHIGSSHQFPIRSLSINQWVKLIDNILTDLSCELVFIGNDYEKIIIDQIINLCKIKNITKRVKNFAGSTSLKQMLFLIKGAHIVISTDSGPGQIAGLMKKKQLMLFGPTCHKVSYPLNNNCIKIYREDECSPCYGTYMYNNCPNNNKCMDKIGIMSIIYALNKLDDFTFKNEFHSSNFIERINCD